MKIVLANWILKFFLKAQDSNKDIETNICSISIPDNTGLSQNC